MLEYKITKPLLFSVANAESRLFEEMESCDENVFCLFLNDELNCISKPSRYLAPFGRWETIQF